MRRHKKDIRELYDQNDKLCNVTTIEKFIYDTDEERKNHCAKMIQFGYEDSGQIQANLGTLYEPNYVWYGNYTLCEAVISAEL